MRKGHFLQAYQFAILAQDVSMTGGTMTHLSMRPFGKGANWGADQWFALSQKKKNIPWIPVCHSHSTN
jgi:hypothetical protein